MSTSVAIDCITYCAPVASEAGNDRSAMPILWLREGGLDHVQYYKRGFQMVPHRLGGRASFGITVGTALLAAAGCASGNSQASSGPVSPTSGSVAAGAASSTRSTTASSPGPVDQNSPQAQAGIAAYSAMWADVVKVQATMNDQDVTLSDHLTGEALTYFHGATHINRLNGYVSAKGEPKLLHPAVTKIVGSGSSLQILVTDCVDDSGYTKYTSDGTLVTDDDPGGRRFTQALVVPVASGYKVSQIAYSRAGTC